MQRVLLCIMVLRLLTSEISAQEQPSPEAEKFYTLAMAEINSAHVAWVKRTASHVNEQNLDEKSVQNMSARYGAVSNLGQMDIQALVFLVLMEAAKSAQEDLKAIMAKVKSINEEKQNIRQAQQALENKRNTLTQVQLDSIRIISRPQIMSVQNKPVTSPVKEPTRVAKPDTLKRLKTVTTPKATAFEINEVKAELNERMGSISELGEEQSLKLQMTMDRRSKQIQTLNHIMKSLNEMQRGIIRNLK